MVAFIHSSNIVMFFPPSGFLMEELCVSVSLIEPMDFGSLGPPHFFLMEQSINSLLCLLELHLMSVLTVVVLEKFMMLTKGYNIFGRVSITFPSQST